jgi:hypothetical protein
MSEAYLNLNIIGPSLAAGDIKSLLVAVWINKGGFFQGSGNNQRYHSSFTVRDTKKVGHWYLPATY